MPFRSPLDLHEIVGEDDLGHYRKALAGISPPPRESPPVLQARLAGDGELVLYGTGPDRASSCTELTERPVICWDVCGYYRALGVHWKASRRELMQAYHDRNGQDSEYLTYVLKQLLDPRIRREYDATELGVRPMLDRDARAFAKAMAEETARRRSAQRGYEVLTEEVLREWDLKLDQDDQEPADSPEERDTPATVQEFLSWPDQWSWYALGLNEPPRDVSELGEWQRMICVALARSGRTLRFAVGFHPGSSWKIFRLSEGGCIFLIGTEHAEPYMAQEAVEGYEAQDANGTKGDRRMPNLSDAKGADVAEAAASRRSSARIDQVKFDNGTPVVLRVLTPIPEWVTVPVHSYIPTKAKPASWQSDKWPKSMWYVCQNYAKAFGLRDGDGEVVQGEFEPGYGNCYVETAFAGQVGSYDKKLDKPEMQTFALCVIREPVLDQANGQLIGYKDATETWTDADGKKHTVPQLRVLNQKYSNFFSPMRSASYLPPRIVGDKDFMVTRKDTKYEVVSQGNTPDHAPGTESWKAYDEAIKLMGIDLDAMILEHADPEFFARFLIPQDGDQEAEAGDAGATTEGESATAAPAVDQDKLNEFEAALTGAAGK